MATISAERAANSLTALHQKHLSSEQLPTGSLAKIIHLLPEEEQRSARWKFKDAQPQFWGKWGSFRGGLSFVNFNDVVDLLPVRAQFADFVDAKKGDLIVDLGSGTADMAKHFKAQKLAGYVAIDNNPMLEEHARRKLVYLGYHPHTIVHDLSMGLPAALTTIISEAEPAKVNYISNWAMTYLPAKEFLTLAEACFDPKSNHGVEITLSFNMITNGSFDPEVLRDNFRREVVPQHKKSLTGLYRLIKARLATPKMVAFGKELPEIVPVWYPEEIRDILQGRGFEVVLEDQSLLWGQSTAIKVQKKVA